MWAGLDNLNILCKINEYLCIPGFLKTGLAKISAHSTALQFKTIKLIQRLIK